MRGNGRWGKMEKERKRARTSVEKKGKMKGRSERKRQV